MLTTIRNPPNTERTTPDDNQKGIAFHLEVLRSMAIETGAGSGAHLHGLLSLAQAEQADDGVVTLGPDAGVLVLGVVQQGLQQRLDVAGL